MNHGTGVLKACNVSCGLLFCQFRSSPGGVLFNFGGISDLWSSENSEEEVDMNSLHSNIEAMSKGGKSSSGKGGVGKSGGGKSNPNYPSTTGRPSGGGRGNQKK